MPRVSVGLPVYNGERYLREAIESILRQSVEDLELIISDNASTDHTEAICREYVARDRRVRYVRNVRNLGAAKNFNAVFRMSSSPYFKWIAADDAPKPEFLERCLKALDKDPTVVLVFTKIKINDEGERRIWLVDDDLGLESPLARERFARGLLRLRRQHAIWGVIRTCVLRETKLIRPFIGADDCLLLELALKGRFVQLPEVLYRMNSNHPAAYHVLKHTTQWRQGAAEARWYDPDNKGTVFLPYWRRLWEYLLLALRSNESIWAKARMAGFLVCPLGMRWWRRLGSELIFAAGLGGHYVGMKNAITTWARGRLG